MQRRDVLIAAGGTIAAALSAAIGGRNPVRAQDQSSSDAVARRVGDIVAAYDAQGNHRTGTRSRTAPLSLPNDVAETRRNAPDRC
jgi:hypothetical protein